MTFTYEGPAPDRWYALDPKTYKVLGWSYSLLRLRKRFPDGSKVLWSKWRIYRIKEKKYMGRAKHQTKKYGIFNPEAKQFGQPNSSKTKKEKRGTIKK